MAGPATTAALGHQSESGGGAAFRRPGDIQVHFFGTAALSFADGVETRAGDVFEIQAAPFTLPLRSPLVWEEAAAVAVLAL